MGPVGADAEGATVWEFENPHYTARPNTPKASGAGEPIDPWWTFRSLRYEPDDPAVALLDGSQRDSSPLPPGTATGSQHAPGSLSSTQPEEALMDIALLVIVFAAGAAALALFAVGTYRMASRHRSQQQHTRALRERFGPEYDLAVRASGPRDAEEGLDSRLRQYDALDHPPLSPRERERHTAEWAQLQLAFVDAPEHCVHEAEHLVVTVMQERGFPTSDSAVRANSLSVEDPDLAAAYRSAHQVFWLAERGAAAPDQLLEAFTDYRDIFERLLDRPQREASTLSAPVDARALPRIAQELTSR
jgi:hypothetical protein